MLLNITFMFENCIIEPISVYSYLGYYYFNVLIFLYLFRWHSNILVFSMDTTQV